MSIPKILAAMKRDCLLDLSEGFAYDCVRRRGEELDQVDYLRWTVEQFSGTQCIDELHQAPTNPQVRNAGQLSAT
jgi:hypothetical protein